MRKPNIIWFEIDSLRPDFLAARGDNSVEPTFINELIKKGVSFTQCISASPYTIASENSIFTSFYPSINKLNGWFKNTPQNLDKKIVTFADILKSEGYFTACFFPTRIRPYIPPYSFDVYELTDKIEEFLLDRYLSAKSPKFLLVDIETIHDTCCKNRGLFTKQKYYESVKDAAEEIKYFYNKCCDNGDIIIITSDHGIRIIDEPASAYHKDEFVTGMYLTDKTIKSFFLIIANDKVEPGIMVKKMVRTIDIAPTILDTAGLAAMKAQGISLLPYITKPGQIPKLYAFSETGSMYTSPWQPDTWSVRTSEWKLILTKTKRHFFANTGYKKELYNLVNDPYELESKIEEFPDIAEELFKKIESVLLQNSKGVEDYYKQNNFDYKKYLRMRFYPIRIRLKINLLTLINYKLTNRLKTQLKIIASKIKRLVLK